MFIGLILIIIGALLLLQHFGIIASDIWSLFWPIILIALGLVFIVKKKGHHHWASCCGKGKDAGKR